MSGPTKPQPSPSFTAASMMFCIVAPMSTHQKGHRPLDLRPVVHDLVRLLVATVVDLTRSTHGMNCAAHSLIHGPKSGSYSSSPQIRATSRRRRAP